MSTDMATRYATTLELIAPPDLAGLLEQSAELHKHLCPRQMLGAHMGVYAGETVAAVLPIAQRVGPFRTIDVMYAPSSSESSPPPIESGTEETASSAPVRLHRAAPLPDTPAPPM